MGSKKRHFGPNPKVIKKLNQPPAYKSKVTSSKTNFDTIRLNRFIANAGICSRREADKLIEKGEIQVNDKVVTTLGTQIKRSDSVRYQGKLLKQELPVYVLLNKPKGFITSLKDPQNRKTVMDLVKNACQERIYPVGRLDRDTSGLLLFTNDGALARRLSHPSFNIRKIYQVELSKPLEKRDFQSIIEGVELTDGKAPVDNLAHVDPDRRIVGIEIHMGRNRIVRRIFESLGYEVKKLDRVSFAGLTKKDLPRGKWRYLSEKEVIRLKHFQLS
jgi:23S rRNA pseudouridine2605 synthase